MNEPIVKICGISTLATLQSAVAAGADMVGFVQFPPSPRHLALDAAADLRARISGDCDSVALVVDPDNALVDQIVAELTPDWIQLHGGETPERVAEIKNRSGCKIIKALGIRTSDDVAQVAPYVDRADLFILDAKPSEEAARPGGLGEPFDWKLLEGLPPDLRYLLAGGLTLQTVGLALTSTKACGVDASSSLETAPGVKDPALIVSFVQNAKAAWL